MENVENWLEDFGEWLKGKYSKTWASEVFRNVKKYYWMIEGDLRRIESFSQSKKNNVIKALIALSKYLGIYDEFRLRLKNYGIKLESPDSFRAFMRIMEKKKGLKEWVRDCLNGLDESMATFVEFVMISGLRKGEAVESFNKVIMLSKRGELDRYYNFELKALEHFRFREKFVRKTKNAFISFIPREFVEKIAKCKPVSYPTLKRSLKCLGLNSRFNELRDDYATFMVRNGLIREEVDLLQGRVGKSIFMRHYFSPAIKDLRDRALKAVNKMMETLT
jgi:intergrase/recombinase